MLQSLGHKEKTLELMKMKDKIIALRKEGLSYKEISQRLMISKSTAHNYGKLVELTPKQKQNLHLKVTQNWKDFCKKYAQEKKIDIKHKELTVEKARILGHCLGDGSVTDDIIRYFNISISLSNEFKNDMKTVYGVNPGKKHILDRPNRQRLYVLDYYSKKICKDLKRYAPSFSTKSPYCHIPHQVIRCKNDLIVSEFLRVFWEDEGSISNDNLIRLKIKGRKVRDDLAKLHKRLNIKTTSYEEKDSSGIYVRSSLKNLKNFRKICFRKSKVTSGKNKGKLKFNLLKLYIKKKSGL